MRRAALAAAAAVPVALPLLVLAASPGRLVAALPRYRYEPLPGDAYGYYACVREVISAARRGSLLMVVAAAAAATLVAVARRSRLRVEWKVVAASWALGLPAAVVAEQARFTGAAQLGWPLLWSIPMLPLRILGAAGPGTAFAVGLALSVAANVATVLASHALARRAGLGATGALAVAALVALWPLFSLATGPRAAWNGTWQVWLGLSLYTEPVSTAAVTVALALLLSPRGHTAEVALAGLLLGFATLVRVSNILILVVALGTVCFLHSRRAVPALLAASAAWAPTTLLYWPKGYPKLKPPTFPAHPFAVSYAPRAWADSYLWHPSVLLVLVPVALLGAIALRRAVGVALGGAVVTTATLYTFYELTPIHPRFLYVVVPAALVLWVAGLDAAAGRVVRR